MKATRRDFKDFLRDEFEKKIKSNPRYSLRSFAKHLDIDPSFLSKIFKGQRKITGKFLVNICAHLGVSPKDFSDFRKGKKVYQFKELKNIPSPQLFELDQDQFKSIADWYHYAILELTKISSFQPSAAWISNVLAIPIREAENAVKRLFKLNLLKEVGGNWSITGQNTTMGNRFTAPAFRQLQKQVLEKAQEALEEIPFEVRSQTSMTMAIDSMRIEEAKDLINEFRRKFTALMQSEGSADTVYHLGVSFYPVSKMESAENQKVKLK